MAWLMVPGVTGGVSRRRLSVPSLGLILIAAIAGCAPVRPWQRERLAGPAMQFRMAPLSEAQHESIQEIAEGGNFPSAGPGSSGAGCGCH